MHALPDQLRRRGRELELSDAEIARRCGLSARRYANYVAGIREPDFATLLKICAVLATTPNDLLQVDERTAPIVHREPGAKGDERERLLARLIAATNALELEDVSLAVKQVEVLLDHRLEQRRRES